MKLQSNCVYPIFNRALSLEGIQFTLPEFFVAYGGQDYFSKLNNDNSTIEIAACHYSSLYLERYFGIKIDILKITKDELLELFNNEDRLLIALNCYYLPYDKLNYKKNSDEHWVWLKRESNNRNFYFFDNKYSGELQKEIVCEANYNGVNSDIFTIAVINQKFSKDRKKLLENKTQSLIQIQTLEFENLLGNIDSFYDKVTLYLNKVNSQEEPYKTINIFSLVRQLLKPNSVIYAKYIQSKFLEQNYGFKNYFVLYTGWVKLAKKLLNCKNTYSYYEINEAINTLNRLKNEEITIVEKIIYEK